MEEQLLLNKQLHRRAGQEYYYNKSNKWLKVKNIIINIFVPTITIISIIFIFINQYKSTLPFHDLCESISYFNSNYWITIILPLFTIAAGISEIVLDLKISNYKILGAKCQEKYDTGEFIFDKSELIDYHKVNEDNLLCEYDKIIASDPKIEENIRRDWYHPELKKLPTHLYGFLAIKCNFEYNQLLRNSYLEYIKTRVLIIAIIIIVFAFGFGGILYLQTIYSLLPWLQSFTKELINHHNYDKKNEQIDKAMDRIYQMILQHKISEEKIKSLTRRLLDETYKDRINAPFTPNYYYNKWKTKHNDIEDNLVKKYVQEISNSLNTQ